MTNLIPISITSQQDQTSCGPTALYAYYQFLGDSITLEETVNDIAQFEEGGGTLAVILGIHALKRNYKVKLHCFNLKIMDPTWFALPAEQIIEKLKLRHERRKLSDKEDIALRHYIHYLELGGELLFEDLSKSLLINYLGQNIPILTGLSCTWLYRSCRENYVTNKYDDIAGDSVGHFVIIHGYDRSEDKVHVADPYRKNPINQTNYYAVDVKRTLNAILLGVISYDGNLLLIEKKGIKS